jgi:hypothetical protein
VSFGNQVAILSLVFFATAKPCAAQIVEQPTERHLVATVGDHDIYLSQIAPGLSVADFKDSAIQQKVLAQRLLMAVRHIVIADELERRSYSPAADAVAERANALAKERWRQLGKTDTERSKVLEKVRERTNKVATALDIWRRDSAKGDRYAAKELIPLGIDAELWADIKRRAETNQDDMKKALEDGQTMDQSQFARQLQDEALYQEKLRMLKDDLLADATVSETMVEHFEQLITDVTRIRLTVYQGQPRELSKLQTDSVRNTVLQSRCMLLGAEELRRSAGGLCAFYASMLAAELDGVKAGSMSGTIWGGGINPAPQVVRIEHVEFGIVRKPPNADEKPDAKKCIRAYMKEQALNTWVAKEVTEKLVLKADWDDILRDYIPIISDGDNE